jgi:hypothetical protein
VRRGRVRVVSEKKKRNRVEGTKRRKQPNPTETKSLPQHEPGMLRAGLKVFRSTSLACLGLGQPSSGSGEVQWRSRQRRLGGGGGEDAAAVRHEVLMGEVTYDLRQ